MLEGNLEVRGLLVLWRYDTIEIARRTHDTVGAFQRRSFSSFQWRLDRAGAPDGRQRLGRRLNRMMTPWISGSEPEVVEFRRLFAIHRKLKQRGVAKPQLDRIASGNPE